MTSDYFGQAFESLKKAVSPAEALYGVKKSKPTIDYTKNNYGVRADSSVDDVANYLLDRLGSHESANNYAADRGLITPGQSASGKYQYIDSTWNNYKGYKRAVDAPPEIQEERMRADILANLARFQGDPFKTVAYHYYPAYAERPELWQQRLVDKNGKPLPDQQSIAEYLSKVFPKERVEGYLASLGATR